MNSTTPPVSDETLLMPDVAFVLDELGDGELCYPAETVAASILDDHGVVVTAKRVREIHKALAVLGFARGGPLFKEDDGLLAGYGYWRAKAGYRLAEYPTLAREVLAMREEMARKDEALIKLEAAGTRVLSAVDKYNTSGGRSLGGPDFFELGRAVAVARAALKGPVA